MVYGSSCESDSQVGNGEGTCPIVVKRRASFAISKFFIKSTTNNSPVIELHEGDNSFVEAGRANATINVKDGKASISCEKVASSKVQAASAQFVPLVRIKHGPKTFSDVNRTAANVNEPRALREGTSIVVGKDLDAPGNLQSVS